MFGTFNQAFLEGKFQLAIESDRTADGGFRSHWTAPNGSVIEATSNDRSDAHRKVTDAVRDGVMNQSIVLGV